ncbi:hypothetical protein Leryth_018548 [Lithospermum erythrorhizon]|nr:hypothetical protein Leryth_018548 [Lithospermum erythrorhizon]
MATFTRTFVDEDGVSKACGCPLLPLKSHTKGPAPVSEQERLEACRTFAEGTKAIINLGLEKFCPGEPGFVSRSILLPQSSEEVGSMTEICFWKFNDLFLLLVLNSNYADKELFEANNGETSVAYRPNGTPNKWWLAFAKRKFMNIITPSAVFRGEKYTCTIF